LDVEPNICFCERSLLLPHKGHSRHYFFVRHCKLFAVLAG
jgi:hypothetical protein